MTPPAHGPPGGGVGSGGGVAPGSDPGLLARLERFQLEVEGAVHGMRSGLHHSRRMGEGLVFAEHLDYQPGDDMRRLDWRAYARSDHYRIKRFEHQVELRATLMLDSSGSMAYGEGSQQKAWAAATLLGGLAHLVSRQGDSVGVATFADGLTDWNAPRAGAQALAQSLLSLAKPPIDGQATNLARSLAAVAERMPARGVVVIASDLLDLRDDALAALTRLRARASRVFVLHTLHRDELELPFEGAQRFVGCEGEEPLETDADEMRRAYRAQLERFTTECRAACDAARARYVLAPTDSSPGEILAQLLSSSGASAWG